MFRMLFRMFRMFLHILYDRVPGPIPTRARSHPHRGGSGPLNKLEIDDEIIFEAAEAPHTKVQKQSIKCRLDEALILPESLKR